MIKIFQRYEDIPDSKLFSEKIPVFATQNYADYLKEIKNHNTFWFACIENNTVSYLLPFALNKKIIFRKGYFLTGVISFFPNNFIEKEKEFLNEVISYIIKYKLCDWIHQGCNWALFNSFPSGSKSVAFGTYKIYLKDKDETELYKLIHERERRNINKAFKSNIKIKKGTEYLNDCLLIINNTAEKANISLLTITEARKLLFYLNGNLKIYVSYLDDIPQSAAINLGNDFGTYGFYMGSIPNAFRGATSYLIWEAILDSKKSNSIFFDFVGARINPEKGSKLERIQRNKKHYGGEFVQGYLWKMVISKWKFRFYQVLLKIYCLIKNKKIKKDIVDEEFERQKNEAINTDS